MFDRYGDETVLQLREIGPPKPGPGQVQVQVAVASLNPVDFKLRAGLFRLLRKPRLPAITGKDFAGRVSALGAGVTGFAIGQRVFGSIDPMPGTGSCAETIVIGLDRVAPTPDGVSDEVAACLGVASGTALQALLTIADLRAHRRLLVTGASGGVGSSAVQLARAIGARIVGVCSTANVDYVRGIGADEVVDYRLADWRERKEIYDVIFDAAGVSSYGAARRNLSPVGHYINTFPKASMFVRSLFVNALASQRSVPFMLKTDRAQLDALGRYAAQGVIRPRIARTVGLLEVAGAERDMAAGSVHGKVVVRVSD
ncbi:MAG: NAD(P)-dependent alcohol dehydrogenase [Burkholderiales bacterium]|nr:NAD(P)-dependent alcohol dehydrogenase [Burkholderiales bacterium]